MSKEKELTQQAIKEATNDALTNQFTKKLGYDARVTRQDIENPHMDELRAVLAEIGKNMQEIGVVPEGLKYMGSAAVHIYLAPALGNVIYVNQLNLRDCPEALAGPAFSDLRGKGLEFYGHKRQVKRSGF